MISPILSSLFVQKLVHIGNFVFKMSDQLISTANWENGRFALFARVIIRRENLHPFSMPIQRPRTDIWFCIGLATTTTFIQKLSDFYPCALYFFTALISL